MIIDQVPMKGWGIVLALEGVSSSSGPGPSSHLNLNLTFWYFSSLLSATECYIVLGSKQGLVMQFENIGFTTWVLAGLFASEISPRH
jgi:hypothetical protein